MDPGARPGHGNGEHGPSSHSVRKSPSLLNMFRGLNQPSKKGVQPAAGSPPAPAYIPEPQLQKRRGPKPDTRPAQTRRQELNRQAQRTHRERKEQYIRTLELQISQLREGYNDDISQANVTIYQQRQALEDAREENRALRQLLTSHGIPFEAQLEQHRATTAAMVGGGGGGAAVASQVSPFHESSGQSTAAFSGSGGPLQTTPATSISPGRSPGPVFGSGSEPADTTAMTTAGATAPPVTVPASAGAALSSYPASAPYQPEYGAQTGGATAVGEMQGIFEKDPQLGIDFILSLEDPCRPHMERLCRRAHDDDEQATPAGHILMASCPPPSIVESAERGQPYAFRTYDLPHANLDTLLNLSKAIVTKDEVTPIMALHTLRTHALYPQLTRDDVLRVLDDLMAKVRCYGFGAVLEEFEFSDSLSRLVASKAEAVAVGSGGGGDDDDYISGAIAAAADVGDSAPPSHEPPPHSRRPLHQRARDEAMYS